MVGIKILFLRHKTTPPVEGCRWCGFPERGHDMVHTAAAGWHGYMSPTRAQTHARMHARVNARVIPEIISLPGPQS